MIYVHDIIAIAGLAIRVSIDYKDAPAEYRHISKEVASLKLLVEKAAPHFTSTAMSEEDYHYGEKVLKDCQSVLESWILLLGDTRGWFLLIGGLYSREPNLVRMISQVYKDGSYQALYY